MLQEEIASGCTGEGLGWMLTKKYTPKIHAKALKQTSRGIIPKGI